ncbi:MAG: UDP-N-acetylglucosamine 1-carboxyvinyltransferase [Firmicutes bacterium]|nr:UDP-N-acetylglucosamine 1-carboxyvinyltransferase [Bacillota bacterium]
MSTALHICGGRTLQGELTIDGSHEAGLALIAACAATTHEVRLYGLPSTRGILRQMDALRRLGRTVEQDGDVWIIHPGVSQTSLDDAPDHAWPSLLFLGPVLAQRGEFSLALPRQSSGRSGFLDPYIKILKALGVTPDIDAGRVRADISDLEAGDVYLDAPHFGATWTAVTLATRAQGRTRIVGASRAPELVDAVNLLNRMGARIVGAGTEVITITGETEWSGGKHEVIPDRFAAGFYLIAAAATGGDVRLRGVISDHLRALTAKLEETGADVQITTDCIRIVADGEPKPVSLRTGFYPAVPSELRAAMCSLLLGAQGTSIVSETTTESSLYDLTELERMGAQIIRDGQTAVIRGGVRPSAARVRAQDPNSAAALVIAALMADGTSCIENAEELLTCLPDPCDQLVRLGAVVRWEEKSQVAG